MADYGKRTLAGLAALAVVATGFACGGGDENQPPIAKGTFPVFTVDAGETTTRRLRNYFEDPDGDELTYTAESDDQSIATTSVSGFDVTVAGEALGTATITVTASDPDGESAIQEADVIVAQPNRPPRVATPIPDLELMVDESAEIPLILTFVDPDQDNLTYEITNDNEEVATTTIDGNTLTVTGVSAGTANCSITATDPDGESVTDEFTVTVSDDGQ